ncbi:MAG: AAA family ATPase [Bacteroidales bacterium]|nr:AAA family ATPase [Bacteroidales bacterium]MBP3254810.1 AAA family ATPase [Bacteroidales bacterium]
MPGVFADILLKNIGFEPTDDQRRLINVLEDFVFDASRAVFILQGYAGTGKTTVMSALIKTLPSFGLKTVLLAPTGRAAKVLSLYSDRNASTIHKHIYFTHRDDNAFTFRLKDNKYKDTLFIVDESSMIGTGNANGFMERNLLDDLMQYVCSGERCKAVFIGDTAQLPPVNEVLSPALDVGYLQRHYDLQIMSYQLTEVVRQALDSNILKNASNLRYRLDKDKFSLPLFKFQNSEDFKAIAAADFEEYLYQAYNEYGEDEVICVCRSNKTANILNNRIRYTILDKENQLDSGDNLMVVKNNYFWLDSYSKQGFIANGDIFKVKRILGYEQKYGHNFADVAVVFNDYEQEADVEMTVLLDTLNIEKASLDMSGEDSLYYKIFDEYYKDCGNKVQAKKNTLSDKYFNAVQVKFANCLTCHKAQGGGWKAVFVFQNYFTDDMLTKDYLRWLYTAVTRAKEKLFLVNFSEDFFKK